MTARKTLTVQLMELQAQYAELASKFDAVCQQRDELESQLLNAENYIAQQNTARRFPTQVENREPVRTFRNADGVLMGKYAIGNNRFAIRPIAN